MTYYTFWLGLDDIRQNLRNFLLKNITHKRVCFQGSNIETDYYGWADSFEETLLSERSIGSLWTTGDILFCLLENVDILKDEEKKILSSAFKTFMEIRFGIPTISTSGGQPQHGRAQNRSNFEDNSDTDVKIDTLLKRIDVDGFPEK